MLRVNLQVNQAEDDELIRKTDGRLLKDWDVSNPNAYAHYQRSLELQMQGSLDEALGEVVKGGSISIRWIRQITSPSVR